MLNNPNFVSKAPASKVQEEKDKLANYLNKKVVNENNTMYKEMIAENIDIITENKETFNNIHKYITEHKIYERR